MENDGLKDIFDKYEPGLSPAGEFMSRLQTRMKAVEFVREQVAVTRRSTLRSTVIAAIAGFVAGVAFMLVLPSLESWILEQAERTESVIVDLLVEYMMPVQLVVVTSLVILVSFVVYELTSPLPSRRSAGISRGGEAPLLP